MILRIQEDYIKSLYRYRCGNLSVWAGKITEQYKNSLRDGSGRFDGYMLLLDRSGYGHFHASQQFMDVFDPEPGDVVTFHIIREGKHAKFVPSVYEYEHFYNCFKMIRTA